jgi:hypothetical protein
MLHLLQKQMLSVRVFSEIVDTWLIAQRRFHNLVRDPHPVFRPRSEERRYRVSWWILRGERALDGGGALTVVPT